MNKLREHFNALASELNVDVILAVDSDYPDAHWGYAMAHPHYAHAKRRAVILSHPPTKPVSYMVGLHELGHCVRGPGWSADRTMDREAAAWEWAVNNSKHVPLKTAAIYALDFLDGSLTVEGVVPTDDYSRVRRWLQRLARS